jgi:hypothetical protein
VTLQTGASQSRYNLMRSQSACLLLAILVAGCGAPRVDERPPAEIDPAKGNLVALRMVYEDHVETIACQRPWSVWIEWTDSSRVFRVYDRAGRTVRTTESFEEFLGILATLPANIEVERMGDTCGGSRAWAMPGEEWSRLSKVMTSGHRVWAFDEFSDDDRRGLCTCEVLRLEFPR